MALINSLSTPIRGECDLFSVSSTDASVESSFYVEHKPVVNIQDSDARLEFRISGNSNQYLDMSDSFLYLRIKIVGHYGADLKTADNVSTTNNLLHSLFQQCDVYVGNVLISSTNNCYAFKSYIETILSNGSDSMKSQGECALFYKDTNGCVASDVNEGYKKRKAFISGSKAVELIGKLRIDLSGQSRYLLNDTNITIALTRSNDAFALLWTKNDPADPALNPKVKFLDASLYVKKQVVYPSIALSHQKSLQSGLSAQYPHIISDVKQFTIPKGNQSFIEENVFLGNIPSRIIVALVSNAAFNGEYTLNPFLFHHYNANYIGLTVNNIPIPIKPMTLNFASDQNLLPYYVMLSSLGLTADNEGLVISREDYSKGNTLFAFDLNRLYSAESSMILETTGSVRIELKFASGLSEAVTCLVYSESQGILSIDKFRQATIT